MLTPREAGRAEPEPQMGREWWRWNAGLAGGIAYAMECAPDWPDGRKEDAAGHDGLLGWAEFVWSVMDEFASYLDQQGDPGMAGIVREQMPKPPSGGDDG